MAERPVLLTSSASAALLDGRGDLTLPRETRGTRVDWGGVYGQLVRLTGPWTVDLTFDGRKTDLPSLWTSAGPIRGGWQTRHRIEGLELVQDVVAIPQPAGVGRRIRFASSEDRPVPVQVTSRFAPFLFPVLVEGIRPVSFRVAPSPTGVVVRQEGFALRALARAPNLTISVDGAPLTDLDRRGAVRSIEFDHTVEVPAHGRAEIQWEIRGGIGRDLEAAEREVGGECVDLDVVGAALASGEQEWLRRTPELDFPDAPELGIAYRSARSALRALYSAPGDGLVGAVAGYPWYSAIWCRDLAVMLPALLWLGDSEWVERSLTSVFRFQSRRTLPILGGEPGELPMQVAPGPIFLYGTSDSTLRFPEVVEQYHRHAGDRGTVGEWADALHRIVEWGRRRVDPATGLFRHGDEAEAIGTATASLARVRYGIDSPDTTIWDSADRRDHAIDVQVLWWSTLRVTERLLRHTGDHQRRGVCHDQADALAQLLRTRYVLPDGTYLYDTIRKGVPVHQVRPNALRAVSAGLLDGPTAARVVGRAAAADLTSRWGVRTLSSDDPGYDPQAYHEGQVWSIATAWAAEAAFEVGDRDLAVSYLRCLAARYAAESGWANECYRGDRAEPFNSCFLLGFSVAPFLSLLFERLWGIRVDALRGRVRVTPQFPTAWKAARLRHLRVGDGHLDLEWQRRGLVANWSGPGTLVLETTEGEQSLPAGTTAEIEFPVKQA
ncbi:MAG TPA: amylo-alpha-1,6-glucosidase [Thermoplasmata archaeon]|nr:amylo-alpha-1,6-glucosidase [Thermoplasmata archaeon]